LVCRRAMSKERGAASGAGGCLGGVGCDDGDFVKQCHCDVDLISVLYKLEMVCHLPKAQTPSDSRTPGSKKDKKDKSSFLKR